MPDVLGIRFKSCGKIYDFEVNGLEVNEGDYVIVESDFGLSMGRVIRGRRTIEKSERELKRVVRSANEEDFRAKEDNRLLEKEARDFCLERIQTRNLPMKLVATETTLDKKRIVFYFTAEGRIDFRELVKDLASRFKTRIEMRQIGVRDEAKLVGGFGVCGRTLCCNTFLTSFEPVSIKMAKKQEMVLNIGKLSGLCSRLMCCLRYEYDGDLAGISTDDEIPADHDDAMPNKKGRKMPSYLSEFAASAKPSPECGKCCADKKHVAPAETVADADENAEDSEADDSIDAESEQDESGNTTPDNQTAGADGTAQAQLNKKRRRFKRRRFKKNDQQSKPQ